MEKTVKNKLSCKMVAFGAWGQNFHNWQDLSALLNGGDAEVDAIVGPKPDVIPANERRRAPLPVRLAVESSWQATQAAGIDPKELSCVFVSGLGDTQLTDYMCKVLATDNKQLSPTKFHNSVHNAAAGYWTISTGCMKAANSVAGFAESVPLTLLEAITQCVHEQVPVLLTFYDAPSSTILQDLLHNELPFSASIIIAPQGSDYSGLTLEASVEATAAAWPSLKEPSLQVCYGSNPAARILPLLEMMATREKQTHLDESNASMTIPLSAESSIRITLKNQV